MLFSQMRREMYSDFRTNLNGLSTPLSAASANTRTPTTPQSTMMNYARLPHRYTIVTLLSLRPPSEITIFPDHLVERRFLDEENYIDLDRMLLEKAGKFDLESFNLSNAPIMPSRIHKYDFSDPVVIEKVKNRRPKDPLSPQQVAALTSVATRHQSSSTLYSDQLQPAHVWVDDYSHKQAEVNSVRQHLPPQPSMPYQRQNPNQCEIYTNQIKSLLPTMESKTDETIPILQRLFQAQRVQQNEQENMPASETTDMSDYPSPTRKMPTSGAFHAGLSALCTPATPQGNKSLEWNFTSEQNQKDIFVQLINEHLKNSSTMETPATPGVVLTASKNEIIRYNTEDGGDDDEQNFYSAPPSPIHQQDTSLSFFQNQPLENWFGASIYTNTYPRMPSDRVLSACDLEQ